MKGRFTPFFGFFADEHVVVGFSVVVFPDPLLLSLFIDDLFSGPGPGPPVLDPPLLLFWDA